MASEYTCMTAPTYLIENRRDGKFVVNEEAADLLTGIRQPVVVVAIAGLYRTGKSYLMNRLAGKRKGFCLGATVQALTKGIWMWCLPHPHRPDCTLVLLDTEGLGDVRKGNTENDSWIFALAILLSSTLVYNSMVAIDQNALEKLQYVVELTKKIRAKVSSGRSQEDDNSAEFVRFFPAFIWAVRDFTLQLEINGQPVSEDGYLEDALKLQQGDSEQINKCNMPRLCIRKFFPSRKCFTFDRPTNKRNLPRLEELEEEELEVDFLEPMTRFCEHIWKTSQPKTVPGGHTVTGRMLANLVKSYVDAINSGEVPCLENAVLALAEIENSAAMREAISSYEERMGQRLKMPTGTVEELLRVHAECEREANAVFMARAFGENIKSFQEELAQKLKQKQKEFCERNEQESRDRCFAALTGLAQELENGIQRGIYSVPGGYKHFLKKMHEIEEEYHSVPDKGIQADKALEEFLKSKETVAKSILQMDKALTDKEKEIEAQRTEAQAAKLQQKLLEQEQARLAQMLDDQKRSHEEQLQLLNKKMEEEKKKMQEETERMLQHKLKEHEQLVKEGFEQKAREMESEIQRLKEESSNSFMSHLAHLIEKLGPHLIALGGQAMQHKMYSDIAKIPKDSKK
ncbi:guanylate-binding protein 1-like [Elgaria multicarinata webbii]|uniref:guanylate-binding protein 1-like n=1 Tax=Elgaria multicarinata webbii TaxID=159646 RepID=UPI002FCD0120